MADKNNHDKTLSKKKYCSCIKEGIKNVKCVICDMIEAKPMTLYDIQKKCPIHRDKYFLICGESEFVCFKCETFGWYSTAGTGGGTYRLNDKTDQEKLFNGEIVNRKNIS